MLDDSTVIACGVSIRGIASPVAEDWSSGRYCTARPRITTSVAGSSAPLGAGAPPAATAGCDSCGSLPVTTGATSAPRVLLAASKAAAARTITTASRTVRGVSADIGPPVLLSRYQLAAAASRRQQTARVRCLLR